MFSAPRIVAIFVVTPRYVSCRLRCVVIAKMRCQRGAPLLMIARLIKMSEGDMPGERRSMTPLMSGAERYTPWHDVAGFVAVAIPRHAFCLLSLRG